MEVYSNIPLWMLVFWALFVAVISVLFYRKKSWVADIHPNIRLLLISLRALGLFILGALLFGILFQGSNRQVKKPLVITIVDNSSSMLNYADSSLVKKESKALINQLQLSTNDKYSGLIVSLNNKIQNADSLNFKLNKTNLSDRLSNVYDNYYGRNIGAIILLSDGNYNSGLSPLLEANKFKQVPFYTLGVGDTLQKVDQLVQTVTVNQLAFLGNKFPVEVTIVGNKTAGKNEEVDLLEDGKIIQQQTITHSNNAYSLTKIHFLLTAQSVGVHEYTVKVNALPNEYNIKNNKRSFYVEVIDDRSKVLMVAEGLNPDIGAIKDALVSKNNLEVKVVTSDKLPQDLKPFDLIIWHSPGARHQANAFQKIKEAKIPIWYILSPNTPLASIEELPMAKHLRLSSSTDDVSASFNQGFTLFKLSPELRKAMETYPPMRSLYGKVNYSVNNSILAFQRVGPVTKTSPLFYFSKNDEQKFAVTQGTGLWRWRIADYRQNKNHQNFDELINKTVQYLLVKKNKSKLRIHLSTLTTNTSDFIVKAEFYNDSYEPITTPEIHFTLTNANGKDFNYSFLPQTNDYTLNLGKLAKGKYKWKASTEFNQKKYKKVGEFAISELTVEQQDTRANHQLLKQLAVNHTGKFEQLKNYQKVIDDLNNRTDIVPISYASSIYKQLIDYWWILVLVVLLFTAEWGIRKYLGGY